MITKSFKNTVFLYKKRGVEWYLKDLNDRFIFIFFAAKHNLASTRQQKNMLS